MNAATICATCTRTFDAARAPIVNSPFGAAKPHAVGGVVACFDAHDLSRLELVALDEAQELAVLVADAAHDHGLAERAGEQRVVLRLDERAFGSGNRIAVRIRGGPAEHLVDALDQAVRHRVFEVFGLVVDLRPAHAHHLDQEELDQPMASQHARGELFSRRGQPNAGIGLVTDEARFGQRLDHRRGGPGHNPQRGRQLPHGHQRLRGQQGHLSQEYGL